MTLQPAQSGSCATCQHSEYYDGKRLLCRNPDEGDSIVLRTDICNDYVREIGADDEVTA